MKSTFLFLILILTSISSAQDISIAKQIETHQTESKVAYKRIKSGFEFKGYIESPGHNAILEEMKSYYQFMTDSQKVTRSEVEVKKSWIQMQASISRIKKLATYVVIDSEVLLILDTWLKQAGVLLEKNTIQQQEELATQKREQAIKQQIINQQIAIEKTVRQKIEAERIAQINRANEQKLAFFVAQNNSSRIQRGVTQSHYYIPNTDIYEAANTFNTNGKYIKINGRPHFIPSRSNYNSTPRSQRYRNSKFNIKLNF